MMLTTLEKYPIAFLSILVLSMLLIHLEIPTVTIMEARNFITAREMILDNNWLLTTMNGEARYEKPPLPTWLTAFSGILFGVNSLFTLRLPAALMVLFLGIISYFLSLKLRLTKNNAFFNSLILVTSFYIFGIINEAPWDIFAHGFMMAGIYFLFLSFEEKSSIWKNALLSGIFIGLSIMSKGPVSLYALFLPFLISYGFIFKFKNIKILPLLTSIILFSIIGGWWFVYVRLEDPIAFLEIATKESGNWSTYNVKPFYYYWSFFTQSGIWTIPAFISLLYPYLIKKVENKKAYKFIFWWTLFALILLSLIPEKKARYLVPVLIPLAFSTGFYVQYLINNFSKLTSKKETLPVYFNFGLIGFLSISSPIVLFVILKNEIQTYLLSYILTSISTGLIGVLIFKYLFQKKIKSVFYLTILFMASLLIFGLPLSKGFNKNENYNSMANIHAVEKEHRINSYSIGEIAPELLWDYKGLLKNIYKNGLFLPPAEPNFGLLIMNEDVEEISIQLEANYNFNLVETYNLNMGSKSKERLIRQFYLVSKK
ncbi:glycosyltransferase family 39 protein [Lutibacter sp.]|uniref:ArnT family glycosyltransferase n=1 Tax=Lutibacter sp. TaxID=1925666 RepID=UPI0027362061|nr:phospholipid carrier-dependent glycosyltransferase [Lutibacter sp.]MDP3311806.1 glycosyltransferase [Lutibacter sp.]